MYVKHQELGQEQKEIVYINSGQPIPRPIGNTDTTPKVALGAMGLLLALIPTALIVYTAWKVRKL